MKKILLVGFALVLFSCSKEDGFVGNYQSEKEGKTVDNTIVYNSPYNHNTGYLEEDSITYMFSNTTDLNIKIVPYFGYAYNINYGYNPFGLFVPASGIDVNPFDVVSHTSSVSVYHPGVSSLGPHIFYFANTPYFGGLVDTSEIAKRGKLYFIEVYTGNGLMGQVKIPIQHDFDSTSGLSYPWATMGMNDSFFGHELIYNKESREICSTIRSTDSVKDYLKFVDGGRNYMVSAYMNTSSIVFKVFEI
ncbi:hypothetical protein [Myroides sp. WP-1]|uniref:hypothetical protein n=1 Tax=Myroides sp. WP-1 TaxID=2759944 RepID=UPI0015FBF703|nr:hypothetical protein [Myroides sp. WP-1]MBB1139346.1 hypothetical protein [Myroides sp. WP-1]